MDLDAALQTHVAWRMKLRGAISRKEKLDVAGIRAAGRCDLGQWLAGPAKGRFGDVPALATLVRWHDEFHAAAAAVAERVNDGAYAKAEAMLGGGTPYAAASTEVSKAILALQSHGR